VQIDGGLQRSTLPAVITVDLRLASLATRRSRHHEGRKRSNHRPQARRHSRQDHLKALTPPPARKAGRKVESVDELIQVLRTEAKVI
jgi:electron transfer flavoprotein beta subunit